LMSRILRERGLTTREDAAGSPCVVIGLAGEEEGAVVGLREGVLEHRKPAVDVVGRVRIEDADVLAPSQEGVRRRRDDEVVTVVLDE